MSKLTKMLTMSVAAAVLFATTATSFAANDADAAGFPVQQEMHAFSIEFEAPDGGFGFEIGDDWDDDDDWDDHDDWDDDDDWDDHGDWDDDDDDYDPWG